MCEDIKGIAKQISSFSNKEIKHSSALEIAARMQGYSSYADASKYIKAVENLKTEMFKTPDFLKKWEEWKSKRVGIMGSKADRKEEESALWSYRYYVSHFLGKYYRFKDGSTVSLESHYDEEYSYDFHIEKSLFDMDMDDSDDELSDEVFDMLKESGVVFRFHLSDDLIKEKIKTLHPFKFIEWIVEVCDLEINTGTSLHYHYLDGELKEETEDTVDERLPVSSELSVEESSAYLAVSRNDQEFNEVDAAVYELDFLIPSKQLKIRMIYKIEMNFHLNRMEKGDHAEIISEIRDYGGEYAKTLEVLFQRDYCFDNDDPIIYFLYHGHNFYLPFFELKMIQIQDMDKEFERSIKIDMEDGAFISSDDDRFLDYCSVSLLTSGSTKEILEQNKMCIRLMKEKSLLKYEQIMSFLDVMDNESCFREEEIYSGALFEETHGTDICGAAIKYMFSCIDKTLPNFIYIKSVEYIAKAFSNIITYDEGEETIWDQMAWVEHQGEDKRKYISFEKVN